jgi:hypothetical protein
MKRKLVNLSNTLIAESEGSTPLTPRAAAITHDPQTVSRVFYPHTQYFRFILMLSYRFLLRFLRSFSTKIQHVFLVSPSQLSVKPIISLTILPELNKFQSSSSRNFHHSPLNNT